MSSTSIVTALCFFFFCLHDLMANILVAGQTPPPPYVPIDNIALNCGSPLGAPTAHGRFWTADNSKLALLRQNSPSINSKVSESRKTDRTEPYITARLSRSEFTYTFALITTGPKFVRLHFYPTSYPGGFNLSNAFFSVTTGRYTFLSNYSAALHAEALGLEFYVREFCLNVQEKYLSITFTPSPLMVDSYAFINGIEIISMPTNLYYTAPDDNTGVNFINQSNYLPLENTTALELMHRINVAGRFISPLNDNGMFRSWSGDMEYLTDYRPSVDQYNDTVPLRYDNRTVYAAPEELYRTARTMGNSSTVNKNYNLTWQFPVDSAFTYLVRLHFCQFIPILTQTGDLSFTIYIANQTAEIAADIISWSGANAVPVYRDYAVRMEGKPSDKVQNLSIALHPNVDFSRYPDAMLNGVEIFKMSKSESLAAVQVLKTPPIKSGLCPTRRTSF